MENKKFKLSAIIIITIIFLLIVSIAVLAIVNPEFLKNPNILNLKTYKFEAVVLKVFQNSLLTMGLEDNSLYSVGFTEEGDIGFKENQKILVYYDGTVNDIYPGQLNNIQKIKILANECDVEIPLNNLRFAYSSRENVKVTVNDFTNKNISITITDTNEIPYGYTTNYIINAYTKNENYPEKGEVIGEDTQNSTSGFTRNRIRIFIW